MDLASSPLPITVELKRVVQREIFPALLFDEERWTVAANWLTHQFDQHTFMYETGLLDSFIGDITNHELMEVDGRLVPRAVSQITLAEFTGIVDEAQVRAYQRLAVHMGSEVAAMTLIDQFQRIVARMGGGMTMEALRNVLWAHRAALTQPGAMLDLFQATWDARYKNKPRAYIDAFEALGGVITEPPLPPPPPREFL